MPYVISPYEYRVHTLWTGLPWIIPPVAVRTRINQSFPRAWPRHRKRGASYCGITLPTPTRPEVVGKSTPRCSQPARPPAYGAALAKNKDAQLTQHPCILTALHPILPRFFAGQAARSLCCRSASSMLILPAVSSITRPTRLRVGHRSRISALSTRTRTKYFVPQLPYEYEYTQH